VDAVGHGIQCALLVLTVFVLDTRFAAYKPVQEPLWLFRLLENLHKMCVGKLHELTQTALEPTGIIAQFSIPFYNTATELLPQPINLFCN